MFESAGGKPALAYSLGQASRASVNIGPDANPTALGFENPDEDGPLVAPAIGAAPIPTPEVPADGKPPERKMSVEEDLQKAMSEYVHPDDNQSPEDAVEVIIPDPVPAETTTATATAASSSKKDGEKKPRKASVAKTRKGRKDSTSKHRKASTGRKSSKAKQSVGSPKLERSTSIPASRQRRPSHQAKPLTSAYTSRSGLAAAPGRSGRTRATSTTSPSKRVVFASEQGSGAPVAGNVDRPGTALERSNSVSSPSRRRPRAGSLPATTKSRENKGIANASSSKNSATSKGASTSGTAGRPRATSAGRGRAATAGTSKAGPKAAATPGVALLVAHLMPHVKEEGLFRIPASKTRVDALVKQLLAATKSGGKLPDLKPYSNDAHLLAATLKSFLRSLPKPVLDDKLLKMFMSIHAEYYKSDDEKGRLFAYQSVLDLMEGTARRNLALLCKLFLAMIANELTSKMNLQNIGMVVAPSLIRTRSGAGSFHDIGASHRFITSMLQYFDKLDVAGP